MTASVFYRLLESGFPFSPTSKQAVSLERLSKFIFKSSKQDLFLLKGFAGTGKTTIVGSIVKNLWKAKKSAILLAPTDEDSCLLICALELNVNKSESVNNIYLITIGLLLSSKLYQISMNSKYYITPT